MNRILNNRITVSVITLLLILVIVATNHDKFAGIFTSPNTTFEKEVIQKIGNKEVTNVHLFSPSEKNTIYLKDPGEISSILDPLSGLKLKRLDKYPKTIETTDINYSIIIEIEQEITFYVDLVDDGKYLDIKNFKNNSHHRYQIESALDVENIKKYLNTTNSKKPNSE